MEFTGERVIPGQTDPDLFNEHLARYRFAEGLVSGQRVLDAGCGMGYGAAALAERAAVVYGLDVTHEPLAWGRGEYADAGVRFVQGSCEALPFRDGRLDVVVAFEVIEHLEGWRELLSESRRVLRDDGQLLVSTPNRVYYEKSRAEPNAFHVHEFDYEEFRRELEAVFANVTIFFENHTQAISFRTDAVQGVRTALAGGRPEPESSHFFLAVCSAKKQFGTPAFLFVPESGNVLGDREKHIELLEGELRQKGEWLDKATRDLEDLAEKNQQEQRRAQESVDKLEAELEERRAWAQERDHEIAKVRADFARLEKEFDERTAWARNLEADYQDALEKYKALDERASREIVELEERVKERSEWALSLDKEIEALRRRLQELYASPAYRFGRRLGLAPAPPRDE